ncbi:MAG TPA: glycosyltransferase [Thermoanaerobaculia bacterium]|nr:glycosyltransferase [Thermoanaerobaculia bacterium]HXT49750.1 glycosyltransferase [Thermoanaerobaculia bacterium]
MRTSPLRSSLRLALAVLIVALATTGPVAAKEKMSRHGFAADMRKLWEDHITWTRLFIVEATAGLPSKDATTARLLQNQTDLGDAIKPFYGDAAGSKLTALLRDHILIAADLVGAAAAGDTAKQNAANQRWVANADEIAAFLSGANPKHWPAADAKKMMRDHLDLTTKEVVAHLGKDWKADVAAYDAVHAQILHMADMLSSGIEAQFPDQFRE